MSTLLFDIIRNSVYSEKTEVISAATGKPMAWIFDFKAQSLNSLFLREYATSFWNIFSERYEGNVQVGGMEAGAIPLVTGVTLLVPEKNSVNGFYIRKSRKKSDLAKMIEGDLLTDVPIILVDDILNSGQSLRKEVKILQELGYMVVAAFVCLRFRDLSAYQDLIDQGIEIFSIFELNDFSSVLPVKNLPSTNAAGPLLNTYRLEYRIQLTTAPNLHLVVPKSAPILIDDLLYIGADDGSFFCLRSSDGSIVWRYRILFGAAGKMIFSSPAVYQDSVVFGAYDGNLYCLNRFTGKREWVFMDADWIGSSPCIDDETGTVYVGLEFGLKGKHGGVAAIDIRTGQARWKQYGLPGYIHASPAFSKGKGIVVCGSNDRNLYAFDAKTGKIRWKFSAQGEIKYGAVFDETKELVIFGCMDGGVYAVHSRDGILYHRFEARFGFYSTPILFGDRIVIGSLDKKVYCFDLATKKLAWEFETAGRIFSTPLLDGQSIFVGSNDGRLYEFDASNGRVIAVVQLTERIVNRIQCNHDPNGKRVLFIPTHAGELYKMQAVDLV
ncbi:MAG: PQQ-binding-like beta-propeller repeat protein [Undibacterium sp.]